MNRYKLNSEIIVSEWDLQYPINGKKHKIKTIVEESSDGEWVRWSDVVKLREFLENRIPEVRIEKLEKRLGLVMDGKCPECEQCIKDYTPFNGGGFGPEMAATMNEIGLDYGSGHKKGCSLSKIKL
jgi:hypothetical protein